MRLLHLLQINVLTGGFTLVHTYLPNTYPGDGLWWVDDFRPVNFPAPPPKHVNRAIALRRGYAYGDYVILPNCVQFTIPTLIEGQVFTSICLRSGDQPACLL